MKHYPLLLGLVITFFFYGCSGESTNTKDDANGSASVENFTPDVPVTPKLPPLAPAIELAGSETQPFAYLKTIAFPKLLQKAVTVAQTVKPDPQIAMLSAFAGMALGDPALTSIDADSPMNLFVFDEFEGGDLELYKFGDKPDTMKMKKNSILFFPSFILHRVTPVTSGTRKALVGWVHGPNFV